MSNFKQGAIALAAIAVFGTALAQGTPPNPAVTNPAVGAGQQSSQGTSMGTTGVPAAGGGARPAAGTMAAPAPSSGSGTMSGSTSSGATMGTPSSGTRTASAGATTRKAKRDRG